MILLVAVLMQMAAAPGQSSSAPPVSVVNSPDSTDIVVIGRSYEAAERALRECISRHCSPKEEIDASLAYAENQFLVGDYRGSRQTLLKARSRNKKYAKSLPVDVADLLRANGRLAELNGLTESARINAIDSLDALKSGLSGDDPRALAQRLQVGDYFAKDRRFYAARDVYRAVAKQAHEAGLSQIEGLALLRTAVLYVAIAEVNPDYRSDARKAIRMIARTNKPELAPFRDAAATLRDRLDHGPSTRDAAIADNAKLPASKRSREAVLIYSPPIKVDEVGPNNSTVALATGSDTPEWVDITFLIAADGTVHDVEPVRQSDHLEQRWIDLVTKSLAQRLYRPLSPGVGELRRVERYSLVYDVIGGPQSRIRIRSSQPRLKMTDLSVNPRSG